MSFADHQDFLPTEEEVAKIVKEKDLNKRIREIKERVRGESSRKISTYELGNYFMQELDALEKYLRNVL